MFLLQQQAHTHAHTQRDTRKSQEVVDTVLIFTVEVESWVYAYVQTHQIVYIKKCSFSGIQVYLNEAEQETNA